MVARVTERVAGLIPDDASCVAFSPGSLRGSSESVKVKFHRHTKNGFYRTIIVAKMTLKGHAPPFFGGGEGFFDGPKA